MSRDSETAKRLRDLRIKVHGYAGHGGQRAFARNVVEIEPTTWNQAEITGRLSRAIADKLVRKTPGLRYEWLWDGDDRMMPAHLLRLLGLIPGAPEKNLRQP